MFFLAGFLLGFTFGGVVAFLLLAWSVRNPK